MIIFYQKYLYNPLIYEINVDVQFGIEKCFPELTDKNIIFKNRFICNEHFEDNMFLNIKVKNKLTNYAVPTIFKDGILAKRVSHQVNNSFLDLSVLIACWSPVHDSSSSLPVSTSESFVFIHTFPSLHQENCSYKKTPTSKRTNQDIREYTTEN